MAVSVNFIPLHYGFFQLLWQRVRLMRPQRAIQFRRLNKSRPFETNNNSKWLWLWPSLQKMPHKVLLPLGWSQTASVAQALTSTVAEAALRGKRFEVVRV